MVDSFRCGSARAGPARRRAQHFCAFLARGRFHQIAADPYVARPPSLAARRLELDACAGAVLGLGLWQVCKRFGSEGAALGSRLLQDLALARVLQVELWQMKMNRHVDARGPRSHPEVHAAMANAGIDRATVYRNLLDLTEVGLVRRTDLGDHVWRFEPIDAPHRDGDAEHPHFLCTHCGAVTCLPDGAIRLRPPRGGPRALRRKGLEIQLRGLCDACA